MKPSVEKSLYNFNNYIHIPLQKHFAEIIETQKKDGKHKIAGSGVP